MKVVVGDAGDLAKWSLCVSSLRKICNHSSVCFPKCLAAGRLITSLSLFHAVKLNADSIALVQSSFCLPSSSWSASTLCILNCTSSFIFLPYRPIRASHLLLVFSSSLLKIWNCFHTTTTILIIKIKYMHNSLTCRWNQSSQLIRNSLCAVCTATCGLLPGNLKHEGESVAIDKRGMLTDHHVIISLIRYFTVSIILCVAQKRKHTESSIWATEFKLLKRVS